MSPFCVSVFHVDAYATGTSADRRADILERLPRRFAAKYRPSIGALETSRCDRDIPEHNKVKSAVTAINSSILDIACNAQR